MTEPRSAGWPMVPHDDTGQGRCGCPPDTEPATNPEPRWQPDDEAVHDPGPAVIDYAGIPVPERVQPAPARVAESSTSVEVPAPDPVPAVEVRVADTGEAAPGYSCSDKIVRTITTPAGGKVVVKVEKPHPDARATWVRPAAASPGTPEAPALVPWDTECTCLQRDDDGRMTECGKHGLAAKYQRAFERAEVAEAALAARDGEVRQQIADEIERLEPEAKYTVMSPPGSNVGRVMRLIVEDAARIARGES